MRKYRIFILSGLIFIATLIVSCSTEPPTSPPTQPQIQILDSWGDEELNLDIALAPNAVSPAMPSTKIAFDLPNPDLVWFFVYDALGTTVISLSGNFNQGRNEIVLSFAELGSGIYIGNLRTMSGQSGSIKLAYIQ